MKSLAQHLKEAQDLDLNPGIGQKGSLKEVKQN